MEIVLKDILIVTLIVFPIIFYRNIQEMKDDIKYLISIIQSQQAEIQELKNKFET